jgi:acid phosphatase
VLGIFDNQPPLSSTVRNDSRIYVSSRINPMAGRIAFERITCDTTSVASALLENRGTANAANQTFVRIQMNEVYYPIPSCMDGPGFSCLLSTFANMAAQQTLAAGDFATRCGLTNQPPGEGVTTIYWQLNLPWEVTLSP